jgi:hypothetical protein
MPFSIRRRPTNLARFQVFTKKNGQVKLFSKSTTRVKAKKQWGLLRRLYFDNIKPGQERQRRLLRRQGLDPRNIVAVPRRPK